MNDLITFALFLRIALELNMVALSLYSAYSIWRSQRVLGFAFAVFFAALMLASGINYFVSVDVARLIVAFTLTPALFLLFVVWVVALRLRHNYNENDAK